MVCAELQKPAHTNTKQTVLKNQQGWEDGPLVNLMPRKHEGPSWIYLKAGVAVLVYNPSMREGGGGMEANGPGG